MKKVKLNTTFKWGEVKVPKMKKKIFDGERVLISQDDDEFISSSINALFKAYADVYFYEIRDEIEIGEMEEMGVTALWEYCKEIALRDQNSIFHIRKFKDKTLYALSIN